MEKLDRKQVLTGALVVVVLLCLFLVGKQALNTEPLGEARNPNFGHATPRTEKHVGGGPDSFNNQTEEQYFEALKVNRPDLNDDERRKVADHWWKVKSGEASASGG